MKALKKFLIPGIAAILAVAVAVPALANPTFTEGNPTAVSLGCDFGFKVDPPNSGTYNIDGFNTVTITVYDTPDGQAFDWTSTLGMDAVIVKGGPDANVYYYDPESFGDTGLHAPVVPSGKWANLSHIEFCFDYEVTVTKTAVTSFTRTFTWEIVKTVDEDNWDLDTLEVGQTATSTYTVTLTKSEPVDSDWAVSGTVTIANNTPFTATITSATDVISGFGNVTVDFGVTFPYALASGATLEGTYSTALPDAASRVNTATVTTTGTVGGGSATAGVIFGAPTTIINDTIHVTDSYAGNLGAFSASGFVTYQRTFYEEGTYPNTATIVETEQSDDATVTVVGGGGGDDEEPGDGQGLSPGFWKTHPDAWTGYSTGDALGGIFDLGDFGNLGDSTLLEALNFGGSGEYGRAKTLLRQAVAALLNAAYFGEDYGMSEQDIIDEVNSALVSGDTGDLQSDLDDANNQGGEVEDPGPADPTPGYEKDNPGKGKKP
ncbi:hypothetical protein DEALK_12760 [Dehalogenimonas alkenigignens]|uniref:Uncharacterized protein n=1 Tax=Dehalogenimonas alkenigignens TaxID=1217799 RepID=A0A0W0GIR8_9CHLR|nr:hypothetical protein [Dehalogenimonas alkenigignens]KTB48430.1 hypothetical protein DEALK_12760 [Dehalogenimonas alkenigignens]